MSFTCQRYHDFSAGHRVAGHENKCAQLHGHNYRVTFIAEPDDTLDGVGRVVDFSVLKRLGQWLEDNWDHKFLVWQKDPLLPGLLSWELDHDVPKSIVVVPFNPTAENMAEYITMHVAPPLLHGFNVHVVTTTVEETRKCAATYSL